MSDSETNEVKRPNANYQLSRPDTADEKTEGLNFYYNRERRLEKAPELKKLYEENKKGKFGLIGVLVADRPRRFLFAIIILMCLAILILSIFGYLDTSYKLDGNKIEITAINYENSTIVSLTKIAGNANSYTGAVNIAVTPKTEDEPPTQFPAIQDDIFYHRVFFTLEKEEAYRFVVPFNSSELWMVLQSDRSEIRASFKPK